MSEFTHVSDPSIRRTPIVLQPAAIDALREANQCLDTADQALRRRRVEHTDEVLRGCLGLSGDEIASLEADAVIARVPSPGVLARPNALDLSTLLQSGRLREIDPQFRQRLETWLTPPSTS